MCTQHHQKASCFLPWDQSVHPQLPAQSRQVVCFPSRADMKAQNLARDHIGRRGLWPDTDRRHVSANRVNFLAYHRCSSSSSRTHDSASISDKHSAPVSVVAARARSVTGRRASWPETSLWRRACGGSRQPVAAAPRAAAHASTARPPPWRRRSSATACPCQTGMSST